MSTFDFNPEWNERKGPEPVKDILSDCYQYLDAIENPDLYETRGAQKDIIADMLRIPWRV